MRLGKYLELERSRRAPEHGFVLIWLQQNGVVLATIGLMGWLVYALGRGISAAQRTQRTEDVATDQARAERVRREVRAKIKDVKANRIPPPLPRVDAGEQPKRSTTKLPPIDPFGGRQPHRWWHRVRRWFGGK
jgi:hypothetical protein